MNYEEWKQKMEDETHDEHNIEEWHNLGYKGKGTKILNLEWYYGHGKTTYDVIEKTAPEAQIDFCAMGFGKKADVLYHLNIETSTGRSFRLEDLEEFGKFLKEYDIITVSESGSYGSQLEKLFSESGAILISSAGNDDFDGVTGRFKDIGYSIGAVQYIGDTIRRESYSAVGEKVDFVCFHYEREGTSFSAPTFAGLCALLLSKYPNVDKYEMYEVMKSLCLDLGDYGKDKHFGWGLPVLPEEGVIDMLENTIMGIPLIKKPITDFSTRPSYPMNPRYITIHNFGTDHDALSVANYCVNTDEYKSWHFTVGKNVIYQHLPLGINGWHSTDGRYGTGNRDSIGIEIEENEQAMRNAIKLVVHLRLDEKLEIKTHQDWVGKYCPRWILDNYSKEYFIEEVEKLEHWAEKHFQNLKDKGIIIHERRFEDDIDRDETFAMLDRITDDYIDRIDILQKQIDELKG